MRSSSCNELGEPFATSNADVIPPPIKYNQLPRLEGNGDRSIRVEYSGGCCPSHGVLPWWPLRHPQEKMEWSILMPENAQHIGNTLWLQFINAVSYLADVKSIAFPLCDHLIRIGLSPKGRQVSVTGNPIFVVIFDPINSKCTGSRKQNAL